MSMASLEEEITCAIHLDFYKVPKRMPSCQHIFCEGCIDELPQPRPGYVTCPLCNKQQQLPDGGAQNLDTDLLASNLFQKLTCYCGEISANTANCERCHIRYCPGCAVEHDSQVKCGIFTSTRSLANIMTEDFKRKIMSARWGHRKQADKIRAIMEEVDKTLKLVMKQLGSIKSELRSLLPDVKQTESKEKDLVELMSCDDLKKSATILQNANLSQRDGDNHSKVIKTKLETVNKPDLLNPEPMRKVDELLGKLLTAAGVLTDYSGTFVSSVADIRQPEEPTDVAWNPVDNQVCVAVDKCVQYVRPYKATSQNVLTTCDELGLAECLHVTTSDEEIMGEGCKLEFDSRSNRGCSITLPFTREDPLVAMTSHKESEITTLYLLTQQHIHYTTVTSQGFGDETNKLELEIQLKNATDIAADRQGNLYVVDRGNECVFIINQAGKLINTLRESASGLPLEDPLGICIDPYDNILITDAGQQCVHVYDSALRYRISLQDVNNPLHTPKRVAVDRLKRVFVVDSGRKQVVILNPVV